MTAKKSRPSSRSAKKVAAKPRPKRAKAPSRAASPRKGPTKADRLVHMLQRASGASIEELVAEFGTLPHSLRAQISIEKRKRGLVVELADRRYYAR